MGLRNMVGQTVEKVLGPDTTRRLRRAERAGRQRIIAALDVEGRTDTKKAKPAFGAAPAAEKVEHTRAELIELLGQRSEMDAGSPGKLTWASNDPAVPHPAPTMTRHQVLTHLHELVQPRTYLEIGVARGQSLRLSRTRTIAIDPAYNIQSEIACDVRTYRTTSDKFFSGGEGLAHFDGAPIDLGFIDGMHLSEFALRDFINVERFCTPGSVVLFDDILPRNPLEAYRVRRTSAWAGDVYKVYQTLQRLRPDLVMVLLNSAPTGTLIVASLDPQSTVLTESLPELEVQLTEADPQVVPDELMRRSVAVEPEAVFASDVWQRIVDLRNSGAESGYAEVWADLNKVPRLG